MFRPFSPSGWLVVTGFLAQLLLVSLYLSSERAIPFWDYAMYGQMAVNLFQAPSFTAGWTFLVNSLGHKYNLLFALPSLVSFTFWEPTRLVFILTNTFVYVFLYQLGLGLFLARLLGRPLSATLVGAILLCSAVPFFWLPLVQGYPDHAAAACLVWGLVVWQKDPRSWRSAIATGFLLGLAIVLRRHYAYASLALMGALGCVHLVCARSPRAIVPFVFMGVSALSVLLLLQPDYLLQMIATDFIALYKPYERPAAYFLSFALSRIGGGLFLLSLLGWGLAFSAKKMSVRPLTEVGLFVVFFLLAWTLGPSQAGEHYLLPALPLFCFVGLASLWEENRKHAHRLLLATVLFAHTAFVLFFSPTLVFPSDPPKVALAASPRAPWVRQDLGETHALARTLSEHFHPHDSVVVMGSSFVLNQDLVRQALLLENAAPALFSSLVAVPEMGAEEERLLDVWAQGTLFVVPDKPQFHLAPEQQRAVSALWALVQQTAGGFDAVSRPFSLIRDVTASLWRKKDSSPARLHEELSLLRQKIEATRSWVVRSSGDLSVAQENGDSAILMSLLSPQKPRSSFFYDGPLPAMARLESLVVSEGSCSNLTLRLQVLDSEGGVLFSKTMQPLSGRVLFSTSLPANLPRAFLLLESWIDGGASPCRIVFPALQLKSEAKTP